MSLRSFADTKRSISGIVTILALTVSGLVSAQRAVFSADGNGNTTHTVHGAVVTSTMEVHSESNDDLGGIAIHRHSSSTNFGSHIVCLKSEGTHDAPSKLQDGDIICRFVGTGYDGTDYEISSEMRFVADGTVGNDNVPGSVEFYTSGTLFSVFDSARVANFFGTVSTTNLHVATSSALAPTYAVCADANKDVYLKSGANCF